MQILWKRKFYAKLWIGWYVSCGHFSNRKFNWNFKIHFLSKSPARENRNVSHYLIHFVKPVDPTSECEFYCLIYGSPYWFISGPNQILIVNLVFEPQQVQKLFHNMVKVTTINCKTSPKDIYVWTLLGIG